MVVVASSPRYISVDAQGHEACRNALTAGGLVIVPTDTVYGVAALAESPTTLDSLFALKGRKHGMPVALLRPLNPNWGDLGVTPSESVLKLAKAYWPGALTLLVKTSKHWDPRIDGGAGILGLRVPNHPWLLDLLAGLSQPIAVTSANRTGCGEVSDPDSLPDDFLHGVEIVVNAGRLPEAPASTVLDASGEEIRLIREGSLTRETLQRTIQVLK